jgi:hypothetical protein
MNVDMPSDRNVIQMEAENKLEYKNINTEIQGMFEYEVLRHTSNHWGYWNCN